MVPYSQVSVDLIWDLNAQEWNAGGKLKSIPTAKKCSTDTGQTSASGTTSGHFRQLPPKIGTSMSSAEDSPARTSAMLERKPESTGRRADCFLRPFAWLTNSDQKDWFWRTWQRSCFEGEVWMRFLEKWPDSGMCVNGVCYTLPAWEQIIVEPGCFFMPTPTAGTPPKNGLRWDDVGGSDARKMLLKFMSLEETRQHRNPEYIEWQMGFPINWTALEDSETA